MFMGCGSETITWEREWGQVSGKIWWWITVYDFSWGRTIRQTEQNIYIYISHTYIYTVPKAEETIACSGGLEDRYEMGLEEDILGTYRPDWWKR